MTPYLLLDFGTTRTKSALVDLDTGLFLHPQSYPSISRLDGPPGHHAIPLEAIRARFLEICGYYRDELDLPFEGIVLCSEMHGFAVLDEQNRPLTPYLGWKDERSLESVEGISTFALLSEKVGDRFKAITGMRPRPGFALFNLVHLGRAGRLPATGQVVSLPGWLARCSGEGLARDHPTLLAGMAFYDVEERTISAPLLDLTRELTGFIPRLDEPAPEGQVAGYWHRSGERIPIFVGAGDHQVSVLGAGLVAPDALSINLGTGSQVSILDIGIPGDEVEIRPFFDGQRLQTITHVPAGRSLDEYVGFLREVAGGQTDFWPLLGQLTADEILASDLVFDLALFPGSRHYRDGGCIAHIREGRLTLPNYLASLLRSFASQYREVAEILDPRHSLSRCLLSGGIARNLPVLRELIARDTGYETWPAAPLEESLLGLRALALVADGQAATCRQAQQRFGRECRTA